MSNKHNWQTNSIDLIQLNVNTRSGEQIECFQLFGLNLTTRRLLYVNIFESWTNSTYTGTNNNWSLERATHSLAEVTATRYPLFVPSIHSVKHRIQTNTHTTETHSSNWCAIGLVLPFLLNSIFWESNTLSASVSPIMPGRVCHRFIKSMSKCQLMSTLNNSVQNHKAMAILQFCRRNGKWVLHLSVFLLQMNGPKSAVLNLFHNNQWFVLMSDRLRQSVLLRTFRIRHKNHEWLQTQKFRQTVLLELGTWPKGRTTPSTNITCFQSRCPQFVRQYLSVDVRSMLGSAISIPPKEICCAHFVWSWSHLHDDPKFQIVVWSTENGSTWSTIPLLAMVHSWKNDYACHEMLRIFMCAQDMWMEWGWWDQYPPNKCVDSTLSTVNMYWRSIYHLYTCNRCNQKTTWSEPHVICSKMHIWSYLIQLAKLSNFSTLINPISIFLHVQFGQQIVCWFLTVCLYAMNAAVASCRYGQIHAIQTKCCTSNLKKYCCVYFVPFARVFQIEPQGNTYYIMK